MNRVRPTCEICKQAEATRFTLTTDGLWYFMCDSCEDTCPNFLMGDSIECFLRSKATIFEYLISLNKFRLINWTEFFKMIARFMETASAGALDVWTEFYWGKKTMSLKAPDEASI